MAMQPIQISSLCIAAASHSSNLAAEIGYVDVAARPRIPWIREPLQQSLSRMTYGLRPFHVRSAAYGGFYKR